MFAGSLAFVGACGSGATYFRTQDGIDSGAPDGATGAGGQGIGTGGATVVGTGGVASGTGGAEGLGGSGGTTGGTIGSGGRGTIGTGGRSTGGDAAGGAITTGGAGTGGAGTGGAGTGGLAPTGGMGTGGAGTGGGPSQRILSIDFVGGRAAAGAGGTVSIPMLPSEVAGFKPAKNWNSATGASGSLSVLQFADGTSATGANATWNAPLGGSPPGIFGLGYTDQPGDIRMMNGCLNPAWSAAPAAPVTVMTVNGLPGSITAGGYDVYVYVLGGIPSETRAYSYAIGATTINVVQVGPTPAAATPFVYTLAPAGGSGNYIVFRNLTAARFDLLVKPGSQTSTQFRSPVNGIQIVSPSGS